MKKFFDDKIVLLIVILVVIVVAIITINRFRADKTLGNDNGIVFKGSNARIREKEVVYPKAKELQGIAGYINIDKINISENIGKKVILIDFWTYSCINCQRTLPYVTSWWSKYKDKGLLIIGVHTPEFDFEKDYGNVVRATEKYNVKYPVVLDNDYKTWQAYKNLYWPRKYLIDIDGFIVYDHIGEGAYDETEKKIQETLEERNKVLRLDEEVNMSLSNPSVEDVKAGSIKTSEIYFGLLYSRKQFGNPEGWQADKTVHYRYPTSIERDKFYLQGDWKTNPDNMEFTGDYGGIRLEYYAKDVNLVAGSSKPVDISVYIDGNLKKRLTVSNFDLYKIIDGEDYGQHLVEIKMEEPGLMAYTFTFG